ncbi:hypothetical protein VTL71DRAFT_714 [Oculimacula yallundae]|uniref:Secreted protein n=1 Tax=Oculimacula yallundae TaxID=86028 RepID=A0ABR4D1Y0_9HELO
MAVGANTVLHIVQILGVFFCAHHLWPKGVTYGNQEDWEKSYRKRHAHGSSSKSKSKSGRGNGGNAGNENGRRGGGGRSDRSYYEERPQEYERRPRQYEASEFEQRPRHARQGSSRY